MCSTEPARQDCFTLILAAADVSLNVLYSQVTLSAGKAAPPAEELPENVLEMETRRKQLSDQLRDTEKQVRSVNAASTPPHALL